jgi:hypothetical protein
LFGVWDIGEVESMDVVGEVVRKNVGSVSVVDIAKGRRLGSGEYGGEEKEQSMPNIELEEEKRGDH